jgi:hypothetical protein
MDQRGCTTVVPVLNDPNMPTRPLLDFQAGYVQRSIEKFPQQGTIGPWTVEMNYKADYQRLRQGPVEDSALKFSTAAAPAMSGAATA